MNICLTLCKLDWTEFYGIIIFCVVYVILQNVLHTFRTDVTDAQNHGLKYRWYVSVSAYITMSRYDQYCGVKENRICIGDT